MTLYDDLEITANASQEEIKKAFRKLALQHHPDKGGDTSKFHSINHAYETLSDTNKKAEYDETLHYQSHSHSQQFFFHQGRGGGFPFNIFTQQRGGPAHFDLNELFRQMNVSNSFNRPQTKCEDEVMTINISIQQAHEGISKKLRKTMTSVCKTCMQKCPECNGQGAIARPMSNGFFTMMQEIQCGSCNASGFKYQAAASCDCDNGFKTQTLDLLVQVKPDQIVGAKVKYENLGKQPTKFLQIPGHFYVELKVDTPSNTTITSDGTVIYEPEISIKDMICGQTIQLPCSILPALDNAVSITIPALSLKPEFIMKLESKGLAGKELIFKPKINYVVNGFVDIDILRSAFHKNEENS
jgi:DnaJ-class molecular chaperone